MNGYSATQFASSEYSIDLCDCKFTRHRLGTSKHIYVLSVCVRSSVAYFHISRDAVALFRTVISLTCPIGACSYSVRILLTSSTKVEVYVRVMTLSSIKQPTVCACDK